MYGQFANFGQWAEIRSPIEGHFLERVGRTAFEQTIAQNKDRVRVLFHHGQDPHIGYAVLGPIRSLETDTSYEVPLLDTDYNRQLVPGLAAGVYGSSFRFRTIRDELKPHPRRSEHNPHGIPEVTITEASLIEFGPTPLPAYKGTTAGVRSALAVVEAAHCSAHLLGQGERWVTRAKPGVDGIIERERVFAGEAPTWGGERPEWWLDGGDVVDPKPGWWLP